MLALPGKIFIKTYFVINDFSDLAFSKKIFLPHMEVFSFEPPTPDILEFLAMHKCVLGANIFWSSTFRFSKQEHQS